MEGPATLAGWSDCRETEKGETPGAMAGLMISKPRTRAARRRRVDVGKTIKTLEYRVSPDDLERI
jgi:hypothetical protein